MRNNATAIIIVLSFLFSSSSSFYLLELSAAQCLNLALLSEANVLNFYGIIFPGRGTCFHLCFISYLSVPLTYVHIFCNLFLQAKYIKGRDASSLIS